MLTYTYVSEGTFALMEKPKPVLQHERDAIVKVTLASICSSDLHIKHGSVPRAVPGITVGHEMVGIVEEVGSAVTNVKPGDRVTVNVETFCGECFFCKKGYVNNCTDHNGFFSITQSNVQMPVGPAPRISTVSSFVISEICAAQKPVASTSPTSKACRSVTPSGILLRYVWQEPHLQDWRRGRMRLRAGAPADRARKNRHYSTHHPPFPPQPNREGLPNFREQRRRSNKNRYLQ